MKSENGVKMRTVKGKTYRHDVLKPSEPSEMLPSINLPLDIIPEARKWAMGKTYKVVLNLRMRSIREDRYDNGAGFDVTGVGVPKNAQIKGAKPAKVESRYEVSESKSDDDHEYRG